MDILLELQACFETLPKIKASAIFHTFSWSGIFGQRLLLLICSTTIIDAPNGIIIIIVLFVKPLRHLKVDILLELQACFGTLPRIKVSTIFFVLFSWSGIFGQRPTPLICSTTIIEALNGIIVIVVLFVKPLRHH